MFESFSSRANQSAVDKLIQLATGKKGSEPLEEARPAAESTEQPQEQMTAAAVEEQPPATAAPEIESEPSGAPVEARPQVADLLKSLAKKPEPVVEEAIDERPFQEPPAEVAVEEASVAVQEEVVAEPPPAEEPVAETAPEAVTEAAPAPVQESAPVAEPPVDERPFYEPPPAEPAVEAAAPVEVIAEEPPPAEPVSEPVVETAAEPAVEEAKTVEAPAEAVAAEPVSEKPAEAEKPAAEKKASAAAPAAAKAEESAREDAGEAAAEQAEKAAHAGEKDDEPFNLEKFRQRQAERRQRRGSDIFPSPDETTFLRSRYRDSQRDEVTEEELKTLSRDPMWKTLVQFKGWLPVVTRVLPLLDLAGKRASSGNSEEIKDSVEGLLVSNRDMRTTLQTQTVELKRVEEEISRLREASDKNAYEQSAISEDVRGIQRLMKNAFLYLGILLGLMVVAVGYMGFLVFRYLNHPMH